MIYNLVLFDLDGTLLNSNGYLSAVNLNALKKVIRNDIKVILCSGRPYFGITAFLKVIDPSAPLIAVNGALIRIGNNIIYKKIIKKDFVLKAVDVFYRHGIYFHMYIDDDIVSESLELGALWYHNRNNTLPPGDRIKIKIIKNIKKYIEEKSSQVFKIMPMSEDGVKLKAVFNEIKNMDYGEITSSHYNNFEIAPEGVAKGRALEFLTEYLGFQISQTMAIGDNGNDLSLLRTAGFSVAMGNAIGELKETADFVTVSNNDDGVAFAVEKILLKS